MDPAFDEQLYGDFPRLYRKRLEWGFQCENGWFRLLVDLSRQIEAQIEAMPPEEAETIHAVQVKEKFGTLRFYMTRSSPVISELIRDAEERSSRTCERCGRPGVLRTGHWWSVSCDACDSGGEL